MEYKSYQHIEKIGKNEIRDLLNGNCFIQPKIDGTNGVVYLDNNEVKAGSRKRALTIEHDNADFLYIIRKDENIKNYLLEHPNHYLYGEWLVPHSLRQYKEDAWRKFYIFDVFDTETQSYMSYNDYVKELEKYNLNYIPLLKEINCPTNEDLINIMKLNHFLLPEDVIGEGIVIKRYDYKNQFGHTIWGKMIAEEFFDTKQKLRKSNHDKKEKIQNGDNETKFVELNVTDALIKKEFAKAQNEFPDGKLNVLLGKTLSAVYESLIREELVDFILKNKTITLNFSVIKYKTQEKTKEVLRKENLLVF